MQKHYKATVKKCTLIQNTLIFKTCLSIDMSNGLLLLLALPEVNIHPLHATEHVILMI